MEANLVILEILLQQNKHLQYPKSKIAIFTPLHYFRSAKIHLRLLFINQENGKRAHSTVPVWENEMHKSDMSLSSQT